MVHIGKAIGWARKSVGLTQTQVAQRLGCDRSWVYRLETGTNCPSHDFVESAAELFGMHNVEQMKCGCLPDRLALMDGKQLASIRSKLRRIPNGMQEVELAKNGVRLPSENVLQVLADVLCGGSQEGLLYGVTETAEVSAAK